MSGDADPPPPTGVAVPDDASDHSQEHDTEDEFDDDDEGEAAQPAGREEDWDEWQGDGGDADEDATKSLFGPEVLPSPDAAMKHDGETYGFELRQFAIQEHLDDYGIIRVINFIRQQVAAGQDPRPLLAAPRQPGAPPPPWTDDAHLRPFLEDDPLLFYDYEDEMTEDEEEGPAAGSSGGPGPADSSPAAAAAAERSGSAVGTSAAAAGAGGAGGAAELARVRAENEALRQALQVMREAFMPEELHDSQEGDGGAGPSTSATPVAPGASAAAAATGAGDAAGAAVAPHTPEAAGAQQQAKKIDDAYFDSYSYFDIHRDMLGDKPRTETYRQALECNPDLIKGKAVMDVGCGTGILSLFACRAGASRVVAVDGSERIAGFARQHAALAGYGGDEAGLMAVVVGKMEEIPKERIPVDKVDVIVSEWMGYALLFESMLGTVLHARDMYLRPGGAILPDIASIFIAGAGGGAGGLDFWRDVYGFDMTPVCDNIRSAGLAQAVVMEVKQEHIVTDTARVKELDLCTMRPEEQDFTSEFELVAQPSLEQPTACHSIVLWFDTAFSARHCGQHPVVLTTSPYAPTTHWTQTLLTLRTPVMLLAADKQGLAAGTPPPATAVSIKGRLSMVRSTRQHRSLDLSLEYSARLSDSTTISETQLFHMGILSPSPP